MKCLEHSRFFQNYITISHIYIRIQKYFDLFFQPTNQPTNQLGITEANKVERLAIATNLV